MPKQIYDLNCPALALSVMEQMDKVMKELCEKHDVSPYMVKGSSRMAGLVEIRAEFAKRCTEFARNIEIGAYLGRDHSAITHYLRYYNA